MTTTPRIATSIEDLIEAAKHPHMGPDDTDASMLRAAAKRIEGGYEAGGSNTKRTVVAVLRAVADLLPEPPQPVTVPRAKLDALREAFPKELTESEARHLYGDLGAAARSLLNAIEETEQ